MGYRGTAEFESYASLFVASPSVGLVRVGLRGTEDFQTHTNHCNIPQDFPLLERFHCINLVNTVLRDGPRHPLIAPSPASGPTFSLRSRIHEYRQGLQIKQWT